MAKGTRETYNERMECDMTIEKIIIWGAGEFGKNTVQCFLPDMCSMEILAVVDKDPAKWGKDLCGIPIMGYDMLTGMIYDRILICAPKFQNEIYSFLISECGIPRQKIEIVEDCAYFIYRRIEEKYEDIDVNTVKDSQKQQVIRYLKHHGARMFCYSFAEKYIHNKLPIFFDNKEKLNYVVHEGKRMYMSPKLQGEETIRQYYNSLCMEQDIKSPHLYQSEKVKIEDGDVVLDVGAAEGFFSLSIIDKASYVYMIEADEAWRKALEATFRPYGDKVRIIEKFAADVDGENKITIDSIIKNERLDFIKMDIEGGERSALKGAVNTLIAHDVKCSICTYHNDNDFDEIQHFFENMEYQTETSDGYILCTGMWEKDNRNLDFRRGIIRGWKG